MMHGCSERKMIPQSAANKTCDKTDFSTASGENSGADGANSRQNQGVSAVPTGAPVSLWRQAHRPMRACHTGTPEGLDAGVLRQYIAKPGTERESPQRDN